MFSKQMESAVLLVHFIFGFPFGFRFVLDPPSVSFISFRSSLVANALAPENVADNEATE